jgi:Amt family ammonium transporter
VEETVKGLAFSLDTIWVLIAGFLVFFMQAGFALVETGFTRKKNAAHTMLMNMMVFCIGAIGYWICGFAFQFGGVNHTYADKWSFAPVTLGDFGPLSSQAMVGGSGFLGLSGFFLAGLGGNVGLLAFFLFQMVFMDTAATIPTGSGAERLKFSAFVVMSLWVAMFIYPLIGNWVWGGGWLQNLGRSAGLGHGAVDFAGSGVVHTVGGAVGLAIAIVLGPRIGKFNKDGSANTITGHNIPMGVLGTIILFFGWFGFNPGSSLGVTGAGISLVGLAAVNTLMAGAAGGVSAMAYMWLLGPTKKPDPGMSVNGVLAGLVAITAPCAFVSTISAVIIGLVGGVLVCLASAWLEKAKIDDPVGAVPVHFFNGLWGVIAVGLFANGNPNTKGWNGALPDTGVTGLFYGDASQLLAQAAEAVTVAVVVFGLSYVFFKVLDGIMGLRVSRDVEIAGLDIPEMGALAYPEDVEVVGDEVELPATSRGSLPSGATA